MKRLPIRGVHEIEHWPKTYRYTFQLPRHKHHVFDFHVNFHRHFGLPEREKLAHSCHEYMIEELSKVRPRDRQSISFYFDVDEIGFSGTGELFPVIRVSKTIYDSIFLEKKHAAAYKKFLDQ
jgi:hypothetical protein